MHFAYVVCCSATCGWLYINYVCLVAKNHHARCSLLSVIYIQIATQGFRLKFLSSMYKKSSKKVSFSDLYLMGWLPCDSVHLCMGGDSIGMHLFLAAPVLSTLLWEVSWPPWIDGRHCCCVPCRYVDK